MTFREKLMQEHPECIDEHYCAGCIGCPCEYGYEEGYLFCDIDDCAACWNRKIPGTEAQKREVVNITLKRTPVVYISGPITGVERYWEAFEKAEDELSAAGFIPLSPARLPSGMTDGQCMEIALGMLRAADAVYFLPHYDKSRGAMLEYRYADYIKKPNSGDIEELKEIFDL